MEWSKSGQVAGMLHEREIPYSVAVGDVAVLLEREKEGCSVIKTFKRKSASKRES